MTEGVLLHAASDLVECGGAELDDVEGVKDRDGVVELVIDGVLVAVERVQGGDLDAGTERLVPRLQPRLVGRTRAVGHEVEESCFHLPLLGSGQIDHAGEFLGSAAAVGDGLGGHVVPHVLIDAQGRDLLEPGLVGGHGHE